jgi:hypothetical protein
MGSASVGAANQVSGPHPANTPGITRPATPASSAPAATAQAAPAGATAAQAVNGPGHSGSVLGVPVPSFGGFGNEPTAVTSHPGPAPVANFYGASPPDTFSNTDQGPSGTPTVPVANPNSAVATASGPVSNGTGAPFVDDQAVVVPAADTGQVENPQESGGPLIWIIAVTAFLLGSIFGLVRWTQPGGIA